MTRRAQPVPTPSPERRTTGSSGRRSGSAAGAANVSKSARKAARELSNLTPELRYRALLGIMAPLLELFGDVDDVFSEDDAMTAEKRQMGMGRLYRAWKKAREALDVGYNPDNDPRGEVSEGPSLQLADGSVLRPRRRRTQRSRAPRT